MFAATLLFCLHTVLAPPQCGSLTDKRGPYKTEALCKIRLAEMQAHFNGLLRSRGFRGTAQRRSVCTKLVKEIGI